MSRKKAGLRTKSGRLSRAKDAPQTKAAQELTLAPARHARSVRLAPKLRDMALDPMAGCLAGRTILAEVTAPDERADLWNAVQHIRKTYAAYDRVFGMNRYAQVARILSPVSAMEADASSPAFDDRDDETRQRHATSAWMQVHGWLGCVSASARSECVRLCIDLPDEGRCRDVTGFLAALGVAVKGLRG